MDAITTARIFSDIFLAGSVVFCAVKMFKSGVSYAHLRKVQDLESTIRELIKEADTAGGNLQDALERRQRNLDRSITELEAIESRATKAVEGAQNFVTHIDGTVSRAKESLNDVALSAQKIVQKVHEEVQRKNIELSQIVQQPLRDSRREIFEDERPYHLENPIQTTKPLRTHIERESIAAPQDDLQHVVQFAGQLLEAGRDIEFVSARTKISVPQLRALFPEAEKAPMRLTQSTIPESQRIEVRSDMRSDPRLGALGGMKRVTQTL